MTAPTPGRANSTTPNAIDTSPPRMNSARVPAGSSAAKAAAISTTPAMTAQVPTISTSTRAVGPGQARATTPAARSTSPRSRCPNTGPAVRLLNARMASRPAAMNAYTANRMTRASTVTWGQASAMMPTATARMPRQIREALSDLNMTTSFPCCCPVLKGSYHF